MLRAKGAGEQSISEKEKTPRLSVFVVKILSDRIYTNLLSP